MSTELVSLSPASLPCPVLSVSLVVPEPIARAGESAARRYLEFFTANIRNPNTRAAYGVAVERFFSWCDQYGWTLEQLEPMHLAAYVELLGRELAAPSVKQHLAAIRVLFDWLVTGQVVRFNPAAAVRGPKYVARRGKTPVLSTEDARKLLDSISTDTIVGLRDRALIAVMVYSFARVSAVLGMRVGDYYLQGGRASFRLHEKGGKLHAVPAHHKAEQYVDEYLRAAGVDPEKREYASLPFFRAANRKRELTDRAPHPARCAGDGEAAGATGWASLLHLQSHLPGDRHHVVSRNRRHHRERPGHRRPWIPAHHQALRPDLGRNQLKRIERISI